MADAETILDEIASAIETLGLSEKDCALLDDAKASGVRNRIAESFLSVPDSKWWWEHFKLDSVSIRCADQMGFKRLPELVPDADAPLFFVAEDSSLPFYPVYEASARVVSAIIGECYGFEYYLVPEDYAWLLCENHHDYLIGAGQPIMQGLQELGTQLDE